MKVFKHEPRGLDEFQGREPGPFQHFMSGAESHCGVWISYDKRSKHIALEVQRENASANLKLDAEQAREIARLLIDASTELDGRINDAYSNVGGES